MHQYKYFTPHRLYVDLPLWKAMDQNSEQVTVSSGQDVFFISSDAKEWIYVRAKDGTEGTSMWMVKMSAMSADPARKFFRS